MDRQLIINALVDEYDSDPEMATRAVGVAEDYIASAIEQDTNLGDIVENIYSTQRFWTEPKPTEV